ncbi:signal recognition particle protein [Alphaproteobacteria bacterium]|nr:signal recognition particle protein [Alphaproteobacteria bacterium]MDA8625428.1 signal recognition particle protein [Alphaproteobacteria bacterium]MDA8643074.1 signal recognition particle protein [Alphaproteobacteria bacterium]MDA9590661.1 signal recognition particle protein [Alphaproteobacteria bacterium]MDB2381061.1 signal recognition particle protein [Alphaproteobacteria bacterium]
MFDTLSENLGSIFDRLTRRGALSEAQVEEALGEIRKALLEADVALPVVRSFIDQVRPLAVGSNVLKSVTPGQQVIKIVNDALIDMLGAPAPLKFDAVPPVVMMMVGLQGSGKTTSTGKLAKFITETEKRKVLMASLDTQRPAAMQQLAVLGEQTGIQTLPIVDGQAPVDIAKRAVQAGKLGGFDVVMLDTAGRTNADEVLMAEMAAIEKAAAPTETLLVADSLTGQEAVNIAAQFAARVTLSGILLTRADGDGRGGAALSMRYVTGVPIKFLGVGEAIDKLELFDPQRLANRILGMGDVVGLVEKAAETMDAEKAEKIAARMKKGQFTLDDMAAQLKQMQAMGGMSGVLGMLPSSLLGGGKMKKQLAALNMDERELLRQAAIVSSMTRGERDNPKLMNASRKRRVAGGSGTSVQDVNKVLKMHRQMADMMKKMGKGGLANMMGGLTGSMGGNMGANMEGGSMPQMPSLDPNNLPDLSKLGGDAPADFLKGLGLPNSGPKKK